MMASSKEKENQPDNDSDSESISFVSGGDKNDDYREDGEDDQI